MRSAAPSAPLEASSFVSFDRGVRANAWWQRPDRYRHLEHGGEGLPRIARGGGLSYAAASFGEGLIVQDMKAFDRFLEFDGLAKVRVEAGMTFTKLLSVLARRGCSIPVVPGHPLITVGGAVAADVHGKHPARDGTFADWVECLTLYHPEIGFATLSREREPERFAATCGGFGLTGTIVDVTLRVAPLRSTRVKVEAAPLASLRAAIEPLQASADEDFVYTWHDGTARGHDFGRGVVFRGRFIDDLAPTHALVVARDRADRPMSMSPVSVSVVIPAFNDGATIRTVALAALTALEGLADPIEITIVNDGSTDDSRRICDDLAAAHPQIRVIHHERNQGYGFACRAGIAASRHDWICMIDGDNEYDVSDLAKCCGSATTIDSSSPFATRSCTRRSAS